VVYAHVHTILDRGYQIANAAEPRDPGGCRRNDFGRGKLNESFRVTVPRRRLGSAFPTILSVRGGTAGMEKVIVEARRADLPEEERRIHDEHLQSTWREILLRRNISSR
jgi:hypothetical protein